MEKNNENNERESVENILETNIENTEADSAIVDNTLSLKEEIADLTDKLLRSVAEADNMRKRYDKMLEESKTYAVSNFAKDMLSVLDNMSRALEHKPQDITPELQNVLTGVEMTKQEIINIFKKYKMSSIYPSIGDKFDYNLHSAVSQVPNNEYPAGTVLQVVQEGYLIEGRLLRPAIVTVTKAAE